MVTRIVISLAGAFQKPIRDNLYPVNAGVSTNMVIIYYVGQPRVPLEGVQLFMLESDGTRGMNVTNCSFPTDAYVCNLPTLQLSADNNNPTFQIELTNIIGSDTFEFSLLVQGKVLEWELAPDGSWL